MNPSVQFNKIFFKKIGHFFFWLYKMKYLINFDDFWENHFHDFPGDAILRLKHLSPVLEWS